MVRHGDWKMSTNGVQNHVENGGAQSHGSGGGSLLRDADAGPENASESSLLTDAVVCQSTADIQDGGTGADIARHSSFDDDFIGFDAGHLASADDIVDVGNFSAAIVDGGSSEWLKSGGPDVDAMGKMGLELGVGGEKSVVSVGDLFSSDNPLTSDIPFSLPDGLSLACPIGKLSSGLCHSSPVSPTNFLDDGACPTSSTPAARARSHSETENEDRIQTRAFLEELERGSQLTADDKELMETSRKELQAYEFQVLAHDKNNSLLTPQELETLRVHGLEFEESGETGELPLSVKSETTDNDCQTGVGASFSESGVAASSQSDLSGIVQTSLSFLSDPGKETAPACPLASCLMTVSSQESGFKTLPNGVTAKHSSVATSQKPESLAPKSKPETSSKVRVHKTAAHSKRQQAKPEAVTTKAATLPGISAKPDGSASSITQLVCTGLDGKKQMVQLGTTPAVLPSQPPAVSSSVVTPKTVGIIGDGTASVGAALPVAGGRNVYLTAVPMLYYKDGCLVIPIQQILTTEHPPDAGISSCETTAAVAAVSAETTTAAAAAKPADSTSDLSGQVPVSADRGQTQLSLSTVNTGQQTKLTKNPSKQPSQINKMEYGDTKKWICNICSQAFPRHYKLKLHYMKHTGEKPFKCSQPGCKWAFTTAFKLKRHEESHLGKKDYVCDVDGCGKKFSTVYNLNTHKKSHSRLCTVECPTCGEKYTTQRQLDYHMRAHGHGKKELTYTCPHEGCGRKFFSRYCMGSHMRVHTHLMKIPCPVEGCKRVFDKRCRLQQHMRSHTGEKPFLCTGHGCGAAFATASKLKRHARKHTGERRWVCEVEGCGKAFLRAEHLRAHRITHTGEKPFQCSIPGCTARFKCKSSLYVHLKRHTQNANKESQDSNSNSKTQRNNKHSNKTQNQKNNYSRQIQNALGDLFTLINANDLESLINYQVDTTQQVPDSATAATNSMDTLLQTPHTQSVNPSDILSVNQDGLQTILNIDPTPASVQDMVGQLAQQGTTLAGDILIKDQLRSVINMTSSRKADKKGVASAAGVRKGESLKTNKKLQSSQVMGPSTQTIGFSGAVKVEISRTEFPDSTTLSIQEDQVSSTVNNIINPNEVLTSQAITFRDPETGAIYVQTQLLQDDPPNPDIYGDSSNIVSLDNGDQAGLTDFPNIFNDPSHDDLVDPPGVLEFTGTTINLQDLE